MTYIYNPLEKSKLLPGPPPPPTGSTGLDNESNVIGGVGTITDALNALLIDIEAIENTTVKLTYYEIIDISAGTNGSLTQTPSGATIVENQFGEAGTSVLSTLTVSNNTPTGESPKNGLNQPITANLDTLGNWTASETFVDPVAIIYAFTIPIIDLDTVNENLVIDYQINTGVQLISGDGVDNSNPQSPIISFPTTGDIGAATAAQGALADTAIQPGDNLSELNDDVGIITIETDPIFNASEAANFIAGDKANLDNQSGVNSGDETTGSIQTKRPLKTVEGQTLEGAGNIDITQTDVGLSDVDNTSDLNKPISTATQSALDLKYDANNPNGYETPAQLNTRDSDNRARVNHTGTQPATTITGLATVATTGDYNDLSNLPSIPPVAPVDSVNGQTGTVVLDADDIDDTVTAHKFATAAELAQIGANQTATGVNAVGVATNSSDIATETANRIAGDVSLQAQINLLIKSFFQAAPTADQLNVTNVDVNVTISENVNSDNTIYGLTGNAVTISKTGFFKFTFHVGADTQTGAREHLIVRLQRDTGGGFLDIPTSEGGASGFSYHRNNASGEDTGSFSVILSVTSGDVFRVVANSPSNGVNIIAAGTNLTIEEK